MIKALSYTFIFLGIQLLGGGIASLAASIMADGRWADSPYVLIVSSALSSIVAAALFLGTRWAEVSLNYLKTRPWTVLFWCVMAAVGVVIPSTALQEKLPELPNIIEQQLIEIINTRGGYFVIALLAPVVEELVFRGAILKALLAWKPGGHWGMIAISAALFAAVHINPAQMPHAFLMGLLLGWLYYRTGSILPGVAFHWINNTLAFIMLKLYPDPDIRLVDILGNERNVGAAVIFSLFILGPAIYQLALRLKRPA